MLPLTDHGFALHKSAFHDALALRYGWTPSKLPSKCDCGNSFTVEHALSCARGGLPTIRHNDVRIEPELQAVTTEHLTGATANSQDGARLDISANGVWGGRSEKTYFDVRIFNPYAPSNKNMAPSACYKKHEREKKRAYEQRVREIEHSSFTPLVLAATASMSTVTTLLWGVTNPSAAVSAASSEDSSNVPTGAHSVSSLSRRADFALLCFVLLQDRDITREPRCSWAR